MGYYRGLFVLGLIVIVGVCLTSSREISRSRSDLLDLEVAASGHGHGHHWKKGGGKDHHSDHKSSHGEKGV